MSFFLIQTSHITFQLMLPCVLGISGWAREGRAYVSRQYSVKSSEEIVKYTCMAELQMIGSLAKNDSLSIFYEIFPQ